MVANKKNLIKSVFIVTCFLAALLFLSGRQHIQDGGSVEDRPVARQENDEERKVNIEDASTLELINECSQHYRIGLMTAYSDPQHALSYIRKEYDVLDELLERDDLGLMLADVYLATEVEKNAILRMLYEAILVRDKVLESIPIEKRKLIFDRCYSLTNGVFAYSGTHTLEMAIFLLDFIPLYEEFPYDLFHNGLSSYKKDSLTDDQIKKIEEMLSEFFHFSGE